MQLPSLVNQLASRRLTTQWAEDAEAFLAEARMVASLDHPHTVPVYDVGCTLDGSVYVVSQFTDSADLASELKLQRTKYRDVPNLVATVAEALHYAHKQGLAHRDVKQSGLSESNQCYVDPESLDKEQYPRERNPEANWAPRNWPLELAVVLDWINNWVPGCPHCLVCVNELVFVMIVLLQ